MLAPTPSRVKPAVILRRYTTAWREGKVGFGLLAQTRNTLYQQRGRRERERSLMIGWMGC
jgi:hypothetical protein